MSPALRRHASLAILAVAGLAACAGPAGTGSPFAPATPTTGPTQSGPTPVITGTVTAGPVCPVEQDPPDPACAPRPVAGAVIIATDDAGDEAGRATSADDGTYTLDVSHTGTIVVVAQPVAGYMGTPDPVTVETGEPGPFVVVNFIYDTGIR